MVANEQKSKNEQKDADDQMDANIHLKLVRVFLNIVGLWPDDYSWINYVKRSAFMIITISEAIFQVLGFMDEEKSRENINNFVINMSLYAIYTIRFLAYLLNLDNMQMLLDKVQEERNEITDPEERKIMYAQDLDTMGWNRACTIGTSLSALFMTTYTLLGMYFPKSLPNTIKLHYFPNNPKLFYFKLLHMYVCAILPCSIIIGYDCSTVATCLHASGLFRLTIYRCEVAFNKSEGLSPVEQQKVETQNVRGIVGMHLQAMEFLRCIQAACWKMYLATHGLVMVSMTLCFLRAYDHLIVQPDFPIQELLVHVTLVAIFFYSGFIVNNICQICIDTSADIFWAAGDTAWYKGTIASQKKTLFIMRHCRPCSFDFAGGLYRANLEGYFWSIKIAYTYFTMLSSL